ncbi:MAG: DUF445 family protein [Candidatus Bipolaricaulia bacterium]
MLTPTTPPIYLLVSIPLVSALVGYLTNWVAIRMLFRPHKEKRLFGLRLPFTPGLIPRKRAELAESIAQAVGEHLLTEAAISRRFAAPEVRAKLAELVHEQVQGLLSRELGSPISLIPPQLQEEWAEFIAGLKGRMNGWLASLLHSPELEGLLRAHLSRRVEEALARPVGELLPQELLESLPRRLEALLAELAEDERLERGLREFLADRIEAFFREDRPLGSLLPEPVRLLAYAKLEEFLPTVLARLTRALEDEHLQKRIKLHLYELVDRLMSEQFNEESLWDRMKFGLFETFVISQEELKLRIDQGVEELAPRVAELVGSPEVQRGIYRALIGSLEALLKRRLSELRLDPELLERVEEALGDALLGLMRSPELHKRLVEAAEAGLEKLRARPVKELLPGLEGRALGELLVEQILKAIRAPSAQKALGGFLSERLELLLRRPIGRLKDYLPQRLVLKAEELAAEQLGRLLERETPKILAALDIKGLVRAQVEGFSTEEVERLIVRVTGEQLRAITWFGAVLGFAIGLVQVGIILLGRGR